jgi:hypothetical protein
MDAEALGEDRGGQPGGEREQRGVSPLASAVDPVALQALLQPVGGEVLPGVPARDQPPVAPGPLKLSVAQRLRDLSEWGRGGGSRRDRAAQSLPAFPLPATRATRIYCDHRQLLP